MAEKFITRNGRKFKVTVPDEPKKEKTAVQRADEALKAASDRGAFTLPVQQQVKGISEPPRTDSLEAPQNKPS